MFRIATTVLLLASCGCEMTAPLHVWAPPLIATSPSGVIALAPIDGDPALAGPVQKVMVEAIPQEVGPVIKPDQLGHPHGIQLASASTGSSDISSLAAARQSGADSLLFGEVMSKPIARSRQINTPLLEDGRLLLTWRLIDVESGETIGKAPIGMNIDAAIENYPDLAIYQSSEVNLLTAAAARQSWRVVSPFVTREDVVLVLPWFLLGAEQVRKGNGMARNGRWPEAEIEWENVIRKHPRHHGAMHNLAIAAVARQDFDTARQRIRQAMSYHNSNAYATTFGWIESQRREYHRAFRLADPDDGWPLSQSLETPSP